jgi:hypothetical protein
LRVVLADGLLQGMEILLRDSGATVHAPIAGPWPHSPQGNTDQLPFVPVPKQNYSPNLPRAPLRPYPNLELKLLLAWRLYDQI